MVDRNADLWVNLRARDRTGNVFQRVQSKVRALDRLIPQNEEFRANVLTRGFDVATAGIIRGFAALRGDVDELGKSYGKFITNLENANELLGFSDAERAIRNVNDALLIAQSEGSAAAKAFEQLGINREKFAGANGVTQLGAVTSALRQIQDETERTRVGTSLLGDTYDDVMRVNQQTMDSVADNMARNQLMLDESQRALVARLGEAQQRAQDAAGASANAFTTALLPVRIAVTEMFASINNDIAKNTRTAALMSGVLLGIARTAADIADIINNASRNISLANVGESAKTFGKNVFGQLFQGQTAEESRAATQEMKDRLGLTFSNYRENLDATIKEVEALNEKAIQDAKNRPDPIAEIFAPSDNSSAVDAVQAAAKKQADRMLALQEELAEKRRTTTMRTLDEHERQVKLRAYSYLLLPDPATLEARNRAACEALENAGKETISCLDALRTEIDKKLAADGEQRDAGWEQMLGGVQSAIGGLSALYDAEEQIEEQRHDRKLSMIESEKRALESRFEQAGVLSTAEVKTFQQRAKSLIESEQKVSSAQEQAAQKARRQAKKMVVLQAAVATASAYAAAVNSMTTGAFAGPFAAVANYGAVLGTALTGVAQIKQACAAIGAGGGGGLPSGGAGGGAGGGATPAADGQRFVDNFTRENEPSEEPQPVSLTLFDSALYSAEAVERFIESLSLYGYGVSTNRI